VSQVVGSSHTGYQVADLDRSLRFYRDMLGLAVRVRRVVDDPYIGRIVGYEGVEIDQAFLDIPGSDHWFELLEYRGVARDAVDPATANPGTAHLCLVVRDLTALVERLRAHGHDLAGDLVEVPHGPNQGALAAYVKDPDGMRVELVQPAS
jgi:catechol 2,3-dioxygenase-like lactoylglutathione lyase family enzyme